MPFSLRNHSLLLVFLSFVIFVVAKRERTSSRKGELSTLHFDNSESIATNKGSPLFEQQEKDDWKMHKYESYDEYKDVQTRGNKRKLKLQFVTKPTMTIIGEYIKRTIPLIHKFGLCHGTRRGNEQLWLKEAIQDDSLQILGTEISSTADQFPNTIEWDFHKVKPEWLEKVDFIYSNALDHSFNPTLAISSWMSCLDRKHGTLLVHYAPYSHGESSRLDPFGATFAAYVRLFTSSGEYELVDVISIPELQQDQVSPFSSEGISHKIRDQKDDRIFVIKHRQTKNKKLS